MGKNYTPGYASSMFSDWLAPYMQEYERKKEEREYKAPLGERNIGILNAVLASAQTIKNINDTIEANRLASGQYQVRESDAFDDFAVSDFPLKQRPEAVLRKGKRALFGPGVEPIPQMEDGGSIADKYPELFKKQEMPEIRELTKGEALDMKLSPIASKGEKAVGEVSGALGSIETLEKSKSGIEKGAAIFNLVEQGERGAMKIAEKLAKRKAAKELTKVGAKEVGKVAAQETGKAVAKEGAKAGAKFTSKLAPGVGVALGAHQIATAKNPLGKLGGAFDVAAGVTSFVPGLGTVASGILGGIGTGLSVLGGMSGSKQNTRYRRR